MALRPAKLSVSLFRHPCRKPLSPGKGDNTGTGVPATCLGAMPKARTLCLLAKSFARCKTNRASKTKHPIFYLKEFIDSLDILPLYSIVFNSETALHQLPQRPARAFRGRRNPSFPYRKRGKQHLYSQALSSYRLPCRLWT